MITITAELERELPAGRVITDPDQMLAYCNDEHSYVTPGRPCAVVVAHERDDVVAALRWATRNRVPVIPRGGGTGIVGGTVAVDGCLMLSLAKMTAIRELSADDELAVVEPGVINAELDRQARKHGLMYAPDPSRYLLYP